MFESKEDVKKHYKILLSCMQSYSPLNSCIKKRSDGAMSAYYYNEDEKYIQVTTHWLDGTVTQSIYYEDGRSASKNIE